MSPPKLAKLPSLCKVSNTRFTICLLAALSVLSFSPDSKSEELSDFMRVKLTHSEKILDGLTRADYDLIAKHSQAMSLLCEDEEWQVLKTPEYAERSREFRRSVDAITKAARAKNLDGASLAYVDATMKCISCHSYLRKSTDGRK